MGQLSLAHDLLNPLTGLDSLYVLRTGCPRSRNVSAEAYFARRFPFN